MAVLYQGPTAGLAAAVEQPTMPCLGRACKAGKTGLAKSSSSFEVWSDLGHLCSLFVCRCALP